MNRTPRAPVTLPLRAGLLAGLLTGLLFAPPAAAIDVFLRSPRPGAPALGPVVLEAEVLSLEPVREVVFRIDGAVAARLSEPPWQVGVDVGQENLPHTFEVTATDVTGASATTRTVTPAIQVDMELDLELQQLYVTVTRGGERVVDLPRSAFTVVDEGHPQELVTFEGGDVPLTAVLLVDASLSMDGDRLEAALRGAEAFVAGMHALDEASLMLFSDRILRRTPFGADTEPIAEVLDLADIARARGGTALNDALYAALALLDRRQGRRLVILLSDGTDVESILSARDLQWKARRSQAAVYWIRLRDPEGAPVVARTSAWRNAASHREERKSLTRLVDGSGGRVVDLDRIDEAPGAFREILAELREQVVLGYYPSVAPGDGRWHRVRVEVDGFGLSVRTRGGYVDD